MSSRHTVSAVRGLSVITALAVLVATTFPGIGVAQTPTYVRPSQSAPSCATPNAPSSASMENPTGKTAATPLWSDSIWSSIPASDLGCLTPSPVSRAYQANNWLPFFINSRFQLNKNAHSLLARLHSIQNDAIDPGPFHLHRLSELIEKLQTTRSALRAVDPQFDAARAPLFCNPQLPASPGLGANPPNQSPGAQASNTARIAQNYRRCFQTASQTDVLLTADFFLYTKKMDPFMPVDKSIEVLVDKTPFVSYFSALEPKGFGYKTLRAAYVKYSELAEHGSQVYVHIPYKVHLGDRGQAIRLLQKRLRQAGLYSGPVTGLYDRTTQHALMRFQADSRLRPDGIPGGNTQKRLNASFEYKAAMLAYSLKAIRNSPSRQFTQFIRVNIPQFRLDYYDNGQLQQTEKVIVGKAKGKKVIRQGKLVGENQTPTMVSQIDQLIFNPRWYVDGRIRLELNSKARANPEYFEEHGYVKMESRYRFGEHRIFQKSGPKNALGRVKFDFPNPYAVYLHDTNQRYLFSRSRRDFSHGCIRVDNALQLAKTILDDEGNPYVSKIQTILEGDHEAFVKLSKPVPISVEYIPVVVGKNGRLIFAGDPYGYVAQSSDEIARRW